MRSREWSGAGDGLGTRLTYIIVTVNILICSILSMATCSRVRTHKLIIMVITTVPLFCDFGLCKHPSFRIWELLSQSQSKFMSIVTAAKIMM